MVDVGEIKELMNKSSVTTIGYTSKGEDIKDEILSNFNCIKYEVGASLKSLIRDYSLNSILGDSCVGNEYCILIDLRNYKAPSDSMKINDIVDEYISVGSSNIKLIFYGQSLTYNDNSGQIFHGGQTSIYASGLVFSISDSGEIKILKNRFG
jgi:hypothetical protein